MTKNTNKNNKSKKTKKKSKISQTKIEEGDIILSKMLINKLRHSMLYVIDKSNNNEKLVYHCNQTFTKDNETYSCGINCVGNKKNCIVPNSLKDQFILVKPNYNEIETLFKNNNITLNKKELIDEVIKQMSFFLYNKDIKNLTFLNTVWRVFKRCQISKKKISKKKVDLENKKIISCHESTLLAWKRGLYYFIRNNSSINNNDEIFNIVNTIIPLVPRQCIFNFSRFLAKTPYWNKYIIHN